LQANAAVDAGAEIDPVPVGSLVVFAGAGVDAGDGAGIYAVGNAFADVSHDGMWHSVLLSDRWQAVGFEVSSGSISANCQDYDLALAG
jgi:hypothetical protein